MDMVLGALTIVIAASATVFLALVVINVALFLVLRSRIRQEPLHVQDV